MDDIQPREPKDVLTVFIMKCSNEMGCTWANKRHMIHSCYKKMFL